MSERAPPLAEIGVLKSGSKEVIGQHRHDLLITKLRVGKCIASCLIDSGATHDFISENWVEKNKLTTMESGEEITITLADGRDLALKQKTTSALSLDLGGYLWKQPFTVIPMAGYDIILGKPWLSDHQPQIDFKKNLIGLQDKHSTRHITIRCLNERREEDQPPIEFMSVKQARQALKKGAECVIVKLESTDSQASPNYEIRVDGKERSDIQELLNKHTACFPKELPNKLPPRRTVDHNIDVQPDAKPPSRPPYRLSQPEMAELQKLLRQGCVEPSRSPYGAPVFFVKKADGSLRLVCDWRPLNSITVKNQACLPNIDDLFDSVRGAKYFSKLDLMSGYHQVRVRDEDIPKTAINTPFGQFQFTVMGFGLTNAPATFMALMNDVLRPFIRKSVIVFLDDILIFSKDWKQHLRHVDDVLCALESEQLYCKASKCVFATDSVKFLGHIVTGNTIGPDPEKLQAVTSWPTPSSVKEVRRFLGFANYFRRFIKDYSLTSRPLEELTGKNAKFLWEHKHQQSFSDLRQALISAPVLQLANLDLPFRVVTDASDVALGGVLLQQDRNSDWHPIAYTSRRLRKEECNYTAMERETLAVIHALRVWKLYLFKPFEVITDNQGVKYLRTKSNLSKREARWVEFLADFDFNTVHRPGKENVADALSRCTISEAFGIAVSVDQEPNIQDQLEQGYTTDRVLAPIIDRLQQKDEKLAQRYHWNSERKRLYLKGESTWRLCIPFGPLRKRLLQLSHGVTSTGHPGRDRTYSRLARRYYWPKMSQHVNRYVKSCDTCQRVKGDRPRENLLRPLPVPNRPWQCIGMDFITGLPLTSQGNDMILTFVDRLTKQAHFVPTKATIDAQGVADLYLQNVYRLHGLSESIVSDRDPRFTADFYKSAFKTLGVQLDFSTANHPQTDGITERVHRTIGQILRSVVNHRQNNWEELLHLTEFAYNDMVQGSTCETPFFLNAGFHPSSVTDMLLKDMPSTAARPWLEQQQAALQIAKDCIHDAILKQEHYANQSRRDRRFKVGDKVLVHRDFMSTPVSRDQPCAKFKPRWFGPFKVLRDLGSTVLLKLPAACRAHPVFNTAACKLYNEDAINSAPPPPSPIIDRDGNERFIVESILSQRLFRRQKQFLVKWKGYKEPTWEPVGHLLDESGAPIVPLQNFLRS